MTIEDIGYNNDLESYRKDQKLDSFEVGRVISEHKERYIVKVDVGHVYLMEDAQTFLLQLIAARNLLRQRRHDHEILLSL